MLVHVTCTRVLWWANGHDLLVIGRRHNTYIQEPEGLGGGGGAKAHHACADLETIT